MKIKTIKKLLNKVHEDFADLFSKSVAEVVRKEAFITGGCITSMLLDEEVNDYDYYFKNTASLRTVLEEILLTDNDSDIEFELIELEDRVKIKCSKEESDVIYNLGTKVIITPNAVTIVGNGDKPTIQIVTRFVGIPEEIHDNYDFEHTKCYFDPWSNELSLPQTSLESIITKELKYTGSKYPLASIIRTRKFIQRGWSVNAGQYLKMAIQLNDLDLSNTDVLKEQMVGVDMAYFMQIIEEINSEQEKSSDFKLNTEYVMNLIDEKFDEEWSTN